MTKDDFVIIAGDFGGIWFPANDRTNRKSEDNSLDELERRSFTTLFIPGNHENYARLMSDEFPVAQWHGGMVKRIRPSVLMLLRGELYEIGGATVFAFGGARSHDIRDGLLDGADPAWRDQARTLRRQGKRYYRVKGLSWWEEELPSAQELQHGLDTLEAHDWTVDYVVTHCAPTSVQLLLGRGEGDVLTDWLETVHARLRYRKWFFGHYHEDRMIGDRDELLYERIVRLRTDR